MEKLRKPPFELLERAGRRKRDQLVLPPAGEATPISGSSFFSEQARIGELIQQLHIQPVSYEPNRTNEPDNTENTRHTSNIQKLIRLPLEARRRWFLTRQARHIRGVLERDLHSTDDSQLSILDVGSGTGLFADILHQQMPRARVVCTDIEDRHRGEAPFVQAHGDKLPFLDNSFDAATILYVLHHVPDPVAVLKEMGRISRDKVIVQEDTYKNPLEKLAYNIHVNSYRFGLPSSSVTPVRTDTEWQEVFHQAGFDIDEKTRVYNLSFYPVTRYTYVLSPHKDPNIPVLV